MKNNYRPSKKALRFTLSEEEYREEKLDDPYVDNCSYRLSGIKRLRGKRLSSRHLKNSLIGKCLVHIGNNGGELYDKSVIYITDCNKDTIRGIMINKLLFGSAAIECKPSDEEDMTADAIMKNVYEDLYQGGPENPAHGYVLFPKRDRKEKDHFADIHGEVAISTSFGVLQEILDGEGPKRKIIAMGHCQWQRGELEWELFNNQWLVVPADIELMFDTDLKDRWEKALNKDGNALTRINHVGLA